MSIGEIVLVTGGTRSGKSLFAEKYTAAFGLPVTYIATATVQDAEMAMRVRMHQQRRPVDWEIIEEPLAVAGVVARAGSPGSIIMLDCLTFLITNLLFKQALPEDEELFKKLEEEILQEVKDILKAARDSSANLLVVSNESGLGLIPPDRLSRKYQEIVGRANQLIAETADRVFLVVAGIPVEIKEKGKEILKRLGE